MKLNKKIFTIPITLLSFFSRQTTVNYLVSSLLHSTLKLSVLFIIEIYFDSKTITMFQNFAIKVKNKNVIQNI